MILASEEDGTLRYVGKVGSGLDGAMRGRLIKLLMARRRKTPVVPVEGIAGKGKWVEPGLYCTVRCMERTRDGHLRAPVFVELHDHSTDPNSQ
jgi:bifunctional non-homologous end joining protein LigD